MPSLNDLAAAGLAGLACAGALAQASVADSRTVRIEPRVALTETWTDNLQLSSNRRQLDQITEISPGIRVDIQGEQLRAYVDYSRREIAYSQGSAPSQSQNALNAFGSFEAVAGWAYVDLSGAIARQTISALGLQSPSSALLNANQAEVSTFRISPYVRGRLGDLAHYEARFSRSVTDSDAAAVSGVALSDTSVNMGGDIALSKLGWSAGITRHQTDYSQGRTAEEERLQLGLSYALSSQLQIQVNAGRESSNYTTQDPQRHTTSGFGLNWMPSERTRLLASRMHRSFGGTHQLSVDHRSARTAWRLSDVRDIASTPAQAGVQSLGSVYDVLFGQFASLEPNPVARAQLVNAYLQASGISPDAMAVSGFLASAAYLQRRQDLLVALLGVRDTVTFMATRSESQRLDRLSSAVDDLTAVTRLRQRGFSINYAHRLTPDYSLAALLSRQHSSGAMALQDTTLSLFTLNLVGRHSQHTSVSFGLRHAVASGASSYAETALILQLILQL